jgi:hypothetical protein
MEKASFLEEIKNYSASEARVIVSCLLCLPIPSQPPSTTSSTRSKRHVATVYKDIGTLLVQGRVGNLLSSPHNAACHEIDKPRCYRDQKAKLLKIKRSRSRKARYGRAARWWKLVQPAAWSVRVLQHKLLIVSVLRGFRG